MSEYIEIERTVEVCIDSVYVGEEELNFQITKDNYGDLNIEVELTEEVAKEFLEGRGYTVVE